MAFYNGSNIVIRKPNEWIDGETPIGIVVVPSSHDRYGDGSCGIMSLVTMSQSNPENGYPVTGASEMEPAGGGLYLYGLNEQFGNSVFMSYSALGGNWFGSVRIQVQKESGSTETYFKTNSMVSAYLMWPYIGTGSSTTSEASTEFSNEGGYVQSISGDAACDFNGIRNTAGIYVLTRAANQWTASTFVNQTGSTFSPAATCAARFKTVGTKSFLNVYSGITSNDLSYGTSASTKANKGFWYLPALGELCYIPSKRFEIYKTILALNAKYGNVGLLNYSYGQYGSSTDCGVRYWDIHYDGGTLEAFTKTSLGMPLIRAFMRL